MKSGQMKHKSYSQLMGEQSVHLILKLDTKKPIELSAFVGAFTSLGNEFDRHIRENHPDLKTDAQVFVREVRAGSIEADMFPLLSVLAGVITQMDQMLIVEEFVKRWGYRLTSLIKNETDQPNTKSELKDFSDAVLAIANDPNGIATLEAAKFEDNKKEIRASFKFKTSDARKAQKTIEHRKDELDKITNADYQRVLMVFTRSDIHDAKLGKGAGDRVVIEEISEKPLALMFASNLAEDRIKHEIREADDNVFKKGFEVDVNVKLSNGKPAAYSVTHIHQVFDLPGN